MSESTKAPVGTEARVARAQSASPRGRTDVLVIGAGVTGIYRLRLAREAGFSVHLLEAGSAVGGTRRSHSYLLSQKLRESGSGRSGSRVGRRATVTSTVWSTGSICGVTSASGPG